jgi:hypothetical protein
MSKEEFDDIIRSVTLRKYTAMPSIFMKDGWINGDDNVYVWIAGDDDDYEGRFLNWYTDQPMPYLPWAENRPYKASTTYNYIMTYIEVLQNESTIDAVLLDEEIDSEANPVCTVQSRSLKLRLRGLCSDLSLDREYVYNTSAVGEDICKGRVSSLIQYNTTAKLWHLWNIKDNSSLITSASERESFLLGLHPVRFSLAMNEKCYKEKTIQLIKLTTCKEGFFTCNDGVCIGMSKRCDQTAHCQDESDEKDCKLVVMKKNYNKNIAPFTVDPDNDKIEHLDKSH